MFRQPDASAFSSLELLDTGVYFNSPFFNEFAVKYDVPYLMGTCFTLDGAHKGALFFHRPLGIAGFGDHPRRFVEAVSPLISVGLRCRDLQRQLFAARGVLDRVTMAVLMLDSSGRIAHMNHMAKQFIERNQVLDIVDARVVSARPEVSQDIAEACRRATQGHGPEPVELFVQDQKSRRPRAGAPRSFTHIIVVPLSEQGSCDLWRERVPAVMFLRHSMDQTESAMDAERVLRCGYRCSPAQSRVGALYVLGMSAESIAAAIPSMKPCTVRKHVREVLRRTYTADKIELSVLIQDMLLPVSA